MNHAIRTAALTLAALFVGNIHAAEIDTTAIQRELSVLQGILHTALGNDHPEIMRAALLSGHYLAHQGIVVTIRPRNLARAVHMTSSGRGGRPEFGWHEIPRLVQDVLVDVQVAMAPTNMDGVQRLGEIRSEQRELRVQQRNLRRQILGQRRQLQRLAEDDDPAPLVAAIDRLEDELDVLDEAHENLEREFADELARLEERGSERRQVARQDIEAELDRLRTGIMRTLCDYGASVRSLAADEYITVILQDVVNRPGSQARDRIIVTRKSDLGACQAGSISVEQLTGRATIYES